MDNEEWRQSSSYPDYEVSNFGHVRRRTPGQHTNPGRICRPYRPPAQRHFIVRLSRNGQSRTCIVSRLVAEAFIGPPDIGHNLTRIQHINGDHEDDSAENLRWVTPSACAIPRKLTAEKAARIKSEFEYLSPSVTALARDYGVSRSLIYQLWGGEVWPDVRAPKIVEPEPPKTYSERIRLQKERERQGYWKSSS